MNDTETRVRFDGTVTLGNVLTMLSLLVTIVLAYSTLDKRIALLEQLATVYVPQIEALRSKAGGG